MKYLITGGCGFLGSNLAADLIGKGHELIVFDNLSRKGSRENLKWLKSLGKCSFVEGDVSNFPEISELISSTKPDHIFHLAGQVAMTTSIKNPRLDFETNTLGSFNLLEAVRKHVPEASVLYSSTNKVYGDLEYLIYKEAPSRYVIPEYEHGLPETLTLDFHSPYGVSKGSADQYMLDYARIYGLNTVVFRHSSMYGGRQYATYDQGWIGWFCQKALETVNDKATTFTMSGNGKQVRDVLYASDIVSLYSKVIDNIELCRGQAFNIGGGATNSLSLLEFFDFLEQELKVKLNIEQQPVRESDQKFFVADISKIRSLTSWRPEVSFSEGIKAMLSWLSDA